MLHCMPCSVKNNYSWSSYVRYSPYLTSDFETLFAVILFFKLVLPSI